jgi:lathosterol oxidase
VLTGFLAYRVQHGLPTKPYYDVGEKDWAYTPTSTVGLFVVIDAGAYYAHRTLHIKPLFRKIHRHHHKFIATTPFAAIAMHCVELVSLQASAFVAMFIVPLHPAVIGVVMVYILVFNIIDDSGVDLDSVIPWPLPAAYHHDHHVHFHVNFVQHLMLWDPLPGTLRLPGRTYDKRHLWGPGRCDAQGQKG